MLDIYKFLFSQSSGRFLTVYKKEGSTIVQADAVFELSNVSQRHVMNLLQKFPITPRERQELLPPTERDRNYSQESNNFQCINHFHHLSYHCILVYYHDQGSTNVITFARSPMVSDTNILTGGFVILQF